MNKWRGMAPLLELGARVIDAIWHENHGPRPVRKRKIRARAA